MNRYILRFKKTGQLRYTSHLDLMRLFRRNFKRAGIDLVYSQGFNPQPKISFAQALSLGFESVGEYMEIETQRAYLPDLIVSLVNSHLPYGIVVTDCKEIDYKNDKIASIVEYGEYRVYLDSAIKFSRDTTIEDFIKQDQIFAEKWVKRQRKEVSMDIKPLVEDLTLEASGENLSLLMTLKTGSRANLNPELLLEALFKYDNITGSKGDYRIVRQDLFDINMKPLI